MAIRAFLAIELSINVREALKQFQAQTNAILPVKWMSPDSMHLTVKFLGDVEKGQVPQLQKVLREIAWNISPFSLMITGIGGFPSLKRPRILWAGVSGEVEHLAVLVSCVESALIPLGYAPEDRPYHPHLTLSRIKSNSREVGEIFQTSEDLNKEWVFGELTVDRLCLLQSQLTSHGAIYSRLWELSLERLRNQ